jgi:hypothetical protein
MHAELNEWGDRLAALSAFDAPASGWRGVVAARKSREARLDRRWPVAVAAILLTVTAGLAAWLQSAQRALSADAGRPEPAIATVAADVRAENERLEIILARLPERQAMRGSTAFTVVELEDRLALLDDRLSRVALEPNAPERSEQLWRERVGVLHTLVQVRYADVVGSY